MILAVVPDTVNTYPLPSDDSTHRHPNRQSFPRYARALRRRRRWLGSQRRSAARSARCSSRLAPRERGARLGGRLISIPSWYPPATVSLNQAQPSLLRRRARPPCGAGLDRSSFRAERPNGKGRDRPRRRAWFSLPAWLPVSPSCRCVGGHRRRSCPVVQRRQVTLRCPRQARHHAPPDPTARVPLQLKTPA